MNAKLYGPREEVLVDDDATAAHLSNLTRAVLMVLGEYGNSIEARLHDGTTPMVRAHLTEKLGAVEQLIDQILAGAVALGFAETSPDGEVPR